MIRRLPSTCGELAIENCGCSDGRFSFRDIFNYLKEGQYPENSDKADKRFL